MGTDESEQHQEAHVSISVEDLRNLVDDAKALSAEHERLRLLTLNIFYALEDHMLPGHIRFLIEEARLGEAKFKAGDNDHKWFTKPDHVTAAREHFDKLTRKEP